MNRLSLYFGSIFSLAALVPVTALALPPEKKPSNFFEDRQSAKVGQHSKNAKISDDAQSSDDEGSVMPWQSIPVIIQYKQDPGENEQHGVFVLGGSVKHALHSISSMAAILPAHSLEDLAKDPNVAYISRDRKLGARQVSVTKAEYTTEPISAPQLWAQGFDGTGIGIAVIDSGVNDVEDFSRRQGDQTGDHTGNHTDLSQTLAGLKGSHSRIVYSASFLPNPTDAFDQYGHGSHVAGLIAGNGMSSAGKKYFRTFSGSAPNANIINLRALDADGGGTDSSVIAAIESAIALKDLYNIRVLNLSLGRPIWESYKLDPLCQAVEMAWKAGIVVVVAAGNDGRDLALNAEGYGTIESPGNDPYVVTVGAMRTVGTPGIQDDLVASYSSKGPSFIDHVSKPDLVAPGNLVSSIKYPSDKLAVQNPSFITRYSFYKYKGTSDSSADYFPLSGTSMATGVASGGIALLLQAQPQLTPDQVKAFLMRNANRSYFPRTSSVTDPASGTVYKANYDLFTVGAGYLDVAATLGDIINNGANLPAGTAMSPVAVFDAAAGTTSLVTDPSSLWGGSSLNGSHILWGASNVYGNNMFSPQSAASTALWGDHILWGANDPAGFTSLWDSHILWGASSLEAAHILWGASTVTDAHILWGASTVSDSHILWGASTVSDSHILWGANAPYEF